MKFNGKHCILFILIAFIGACTPQPNKEVPAEYKQGQEFFHRVCSNCHGSDAMGGHTKAPKLIDTDYIKSQFSDEEISETILNGTDNMPPQKNNINDAGIAEIIKYLRYSQQAANLIVEEESDEDESDEEKDEENTPEEKKKDA